VTVSSVVHLAARRGAVAVKRAAEADSLLTLARTVLGDDRPEAVLAHLRQALGLDAVLEERVSGSWVRVAGTPVPAAVTTVAAGAHFRLAAGGDVGAVSPRLMEGFAAQAAAACERQRLRTQAEQSEALAAGNRMRTALLAAVSHDLRTPLASVKASVSTLRQQDVVWTDADRAALLATIEDGADRLGALIANLLDMSRIQTGAVEPFLRVVAVDEVLPAVARAAGAGPAAVLDVSDDLPLLRTDPVLLERAVANLLANAVRHSPPGRPVRVLATFDTATGAVLIDVVDHGPGIPAEDRSRVFEPFQQLGDQRTAGGVGLGLAVAKGFVEAVGGRITALDTPGGGLTMRVQLPVARRPAVAAEPRR
jgi:two-component system sensor histidine kinase KdpD